MDPSLPLPTLGQVTTQLPGNAASAANPTAPNPTATNSTDVTITSASVSSEEESSSMTSTTARGSAVRFDTKMLVLNDASLTGCVLAMMTVGVAVFLLL